MELETLLLLVAFQERIREPNLENGLSCFVSAVGKDIDPGDFQEALARALAAGYIHDPVQLPPGALQCHWHLDLTSTGISQVRALLQDQRKSADELIVSYSSQ